MKIAAVSKSSGGDTIIRYENGYIFTGIVDEKDNPISGIIKSPMGEKYLLDNLKDVDMLQLLGKVQEGKFDNNKITEEV